MTKLNTFLTAVAACVSTLIGIWASFIDGKIKDIDAQTKKLEKREKTEEASYKFAHEFLSQIKGNLENNPKGTQLAVAALNIIAQASSSASGASSDEARAELPIHMALLLGDSGSIAAMDRQLKYRSHWIEFASADQDDQTRLTAIKALCSLSRTGLGERNLGQVETCLTAIDKLLKLINENESTEALRLRTEALAAKTKLVSFLKENNADLDAAILAAGDKRKPQAVRDEVRKNFDLQKTVAALQDTAFKFRSSENQSAPPASQAATTTAERTASVQQTLAATNEALMAAKIVLPAKTEDAARVQPDKPAITALLEQLTNADASTRHAGRSQLALLGQNAVKPLLAEVQKREGKNNQEDYKTRLGVAVALSRMQQPIALDPEDAKLAVSLIGARDADTRLAAADFLMNLESPTSILNAYDALSAMIAHRQGPEKDGNAVMNAAIVLATWARILTPETLAHDNTTSMRDWSRKTVEALRDQLQREDVQGWGHTIGTINDLLRRADRTGKGSVSG